MTRAFVLRLTMGIAAAGTSVVGGVPTAAAQSSAADVPTAVSTSSPADVTQFLPGASPAVVARAASLTTAWGGYDGGSGAAVFSLATELRVVRRLALIVGAAYDKSGSTTFALRPRVGARVQIFAQGASGVDLAASVIFRQDRFTSEDGMIQGTVAVARSFGATSLVGNVIYAQDGEGDDHEGELRMAALRRVRGGLHVGVEGRYMRSIGSTDPFRRERDTPSLETAAGPLVAYMAGNWLVALEAGYTARRTDRLTAGPGVLGGFGAVF